MCELYSLTTNTGHLSPLTLPTGDERCLQGKLTAVSDLMSSSFLQVDKRLETLQAKAVVVQSQTATSGSNVIAEDVANLKLKFGQFKEKVVDAQRTLRVRRRNMDRWADSRKDVRMYGQTDGRMEGRT